VVVKGDKMKEVDTTSWNTTNTDATNTSLFSALPGGNRDGGGNFGGDSSFSLWWSLTENSISNAWFRYLTYYNGDANRFSNYKFNGFSIRCLKD